MIENIDIEKAKKVWSDLPFSGFSLEAQKKRVDWEKEAEKLIAALQKENVGLISGTGTGKTIVALLVILAGNLRTIFLVPSRYLAGQHQRLLEKISGSSENSRVITGLIEKNRRNWNIENGLIIFATGHVLLKDLEKINFSEFDLVVLDEMHNAAGEYPYVEAARIAKENGIKILGLTASPGGIREKIDKIKDSCQISRLVKSDMKSPKKMESVIWVKPTEKLLEIGEMFKVLLEENVSEITDITGIKFNSIDHVFPDEHEKN